MKKINRIQKDGRRSNSVDLLQDGPELPYEQKLSRKGPAPGRTPKSNYPSSAAPQAEQPTTP